MNEITTGYHSRNGSRQRSCVVLGLTEGIEVDLDKNASDEPGGKPFSVPYVSTKSDNGLATPMV